MKVSLLRQVSNDLFDLAQYPRPTRPDRCYSCGVDVEEAPTLDREFKGMTGVSWPGGLVSYGLGRDFQSLGLQANTPARVLLCARCAVAYMKKFNAFMAEKRKESMATGAGKLVVT